MVSRALILISAIAATATPPSLSGGGAPRGADAQVLSVSRDAAWNGLDIPSRPGALKSMLLKYTARCALAAAQSLEAIDPDSGERVTYPGGLGLAPEWRDGTCGADCQEKVSACLLLLSNRTGRHVKLSLLSASASMNEGLRPSDADLPFPHQEGVFFGNVFSGQAYACNGSDAGKGPQVKRFCAVNPESCDGLVPLRGAGSCKDVCETTCSVLSDGSRRCAASSCRDPEGRVWRYPLTAYLRNKIEAGNADDVRGLRRSSEALEGLDRGGAARFDLVDFGARPGSISRLNVEIAAQSRGRVEVWLDGTRRLGTIDVAPTGGVEREQTTPLRADGVAGTHSVLLKVVSGRNIGRLSTLELL